MVEIDFHTHLPKSGTSIQILNTFAQDLPLPEDENFYSVGLHPWHLELVDPEECLQSIDQAMGQKNVLALGECGLDRSVSIDFAVQVRYFRKQIELAEKHSKPLIIHCVRAFPELMKLKAAFKTNIPWIIHGYQGNRVTTFQLIRHNFFFSVGESLLSNQQKKDLVPLIPLDHLFLETDDREIDISAMYSLASQLLQIDQERLGAIILENFKRLF